ncbi:glycosyltransferase family 4 protein [Hymenobacter busanensis]|uniref:Glycosyltransferase family 4 protein n=1 Tax=Hymenobacter busanensis TaxID=2607656 RepID=A0A7L4ZSZ7_9BACT|nr:glycosyltransferase [Hymenobacter busanensis]KAA9339776.1 glycosyltransferase family 4 protein [Hymenobacter busanensis]QHJ06469.1 glycosyltransferase [Hymenobacter busanensis]
MENPAARSVRVLLASVLKPVDDTRMAEKVGRTLAEAGYEVHIAGRSSAPPAFVGGIRQHPIFQAQRLSFDRLAAQWRYWLLLHRLRPAVVIVHAPELLPLTLLWQWLEPRRAFLYDVRENYALNISTQQVYGGFSKRVLAGAIRRIELLAFRRAAGVLLAERSYADELRGLPAGRTYILENKYAGSAPTAAHPAILPMPTEPLRLLYSGTISSLNGVFDAVAWVQHLRQAWPAAQLSIIGFCQQPEELRRLQQLVAEHSSWLRLIGGAQPVPHQEILREIERHHVGLLPYQEHPSSWRCMPTKLYEYLAAGLPVLVPPNPLWEAEVRRHQAGIVVSFRQPLPAPNHLAQQLGGRRFYATGPVAEAHWSSEAPRLLAAVAAACTGR